MIDDKNDGKGTVIKGPWKERAPEEGAFEELLAGPLENRDIYIQSFKAGKSIEEVVAERKSKKRNEIKVLEGRLSARQDDYSVYRNKAAASAFLLLYGALGLTDMLTDLSPATYLIALPAGIALTRYLTKQRRTLLREFRAYTEAEKRAQEQ